jgi:hypothetical protein
MIFSNQYGKEKDNVPDLKTRLENIGPKEIYIWKEMVLQDSSLFEEVYNLIFCDNPRIAWHAAWVVDHVCEAEPIRLEVHVPEIIEQLAKLKSNSLKRHFTRMLIRQKIPGDKAGLLVDVLYKLLSPAEATAVRANSMHLLYKIALSEPDLQSELGSVIHSIIETESSPGIVSAGKKILQALRYQ